MFLSPNFDGIIACVLTLNYKCDCDRGIDELNFQVDNKEPKRCRCIVSSVSELAYNKRRQTFAHTDYDTVNILSFRPLCCMLNVTDGKYLDGLHKEANIQLWFTLTLQQSWYACVNITLSTVKGVAVISIPRSQFDVIVIITTVITRQV